MNYDFKGKCETSGGVDLSINQKALDSYAYTLAFSSLSYGLIFGLYMFVYSGFMAIALVTIGIIGLYALITYLVFAVPLQVWLRRRPENSAV